MKLVDWLHSPWLVVAVLLFTLGIGLGGARRIADCATLLLIVRFVGNPQEAIGPRWRAMGVFRHPPPPCSPKYFRSRLPHDQHYRYGLAAPYERLAVVAQKDLGVCLFTFDQVWQRPFYWAPIPPNGVVVLAILERPEPLPPLVAEIVRPQRFQPRGWSAPTSYVAIRADEMTMADARASWHSRTFELANVARVRIYAADGAIDLPLNETKNEPATSAP